MKVPNHIAIILDGNGRWAKAKGMPRGYGHIKGCANLENICDDIKDLGVKYLTVYAFSTENWKRSREEVEGLMKLFRSYLKKCMKSAEKNHMRVKIIGDPSAFAPDIQEKIRELEEFSKDYDELYFQIALNYGSRDEIVRGKVHSTRKCSQVSDSMTTLERKWLSRTSTIMMMCRLKRDMFRSRTIPRNGTRTMTDLTQVSSIH